MARMTATTTSSRPIIAVPATSQYWFSVIERQRDADEREDQAEQRREVLEQDHRQLGLLGPPDERQYDALPRTLLVSMIAVRNDKLSSTIATTSTTSGTQSFHPLSSRA